MFRKRFYYVFKIQYLGYRFHGWQKQPQVKTLQLMIERTLKFILEGQQFKILAAGRTDAMVSANESAFELFLENEPITDFKAFLELFNHNLPQDIRAIDMQEVNEDFNIINSSKTKEYLYLFTEGQKNHPFCASLISTILDALDIKLMQEGAQLFQGEYFFRSYIYKPSENGTYTRVIDVCEIVENTIYTASYFPETSYLLRVKGTGFGRNQIRLMMGALIKLGRGEISLDYIRQSLLPESTEVMDYIAPASGLILNRIEFD